MGDEARLVLRIANGLGLAGAPGEPDSEEPDEHDGGEAAGQVPEEGRTDRVLPAHAASVCPNELARYLRPPLVRCDLLDLLPEVPDLALGVRGREAPISVLLVGRLLANLRPGRARALTEGVDVLVDVDVRPE